MRRLSKTENKKREIPNQGSQGMVFPLPKMLSLKNKERNQAGSREHLTPMTKRKSFPCYMLIVPATGTDKVRARLHLCFRFLNSDIFILPSVETSETKVLEKVLLASGGPQNITTEPSTTHPFLKNGIFTERGKLSQTCFCL